MQWLAGADIVLFFHGSAGGVIQINSLYFIVHCEVALHCLQQEALVEWCMFQGLGKMGKP